MGEYSEQLERQIEERRKSLDNDIDELERKAKNAVNWRVQFDEHPGTMLGLAFGAGALLAALFGGPRRSSSRPYPRSDFRGDPDLRTSESFRGSEHGKTISRTWDNIKGALVGVALNKVETLVADLVAEHKSQSGESVGSRSNPADTIH